jgi:hypothetical protein
MPLSDQMDVCSQCYRLLDNGTTVPVWEKRMRTTKILSLAIVLLLSAGFASAGDADKLIELDKKWGESEGADALAPMLLDEIIVISADGIGDKEAMLEQADSAEPATGPYEASDYKVRFLSEDIAVMVHSTPTPEPHWSMHVWQKVDGKWRVAATAAVPAAE